jgi:hypothetical protein
MDQDLTFDNLNNFDYLLTSNQIDSERFVQMTNNDMFGNELHQPQHYQFQQSSNHTIRYRQEPQPINRSRPYTLGHLYGAPINRQEVMEAYNMSGKPGNNLKRQGVDNLDILQIKGYKVQTTLAKEKRRLVLFHNIK